MTYCIGLQLRQGLVFMSDTRTNAGVDNISTVKKMHTWCVPGERFIALMTAGNLATTQAVVSMIEERTKLQEDRNPWILTAPSMFQTAQEVGRTLRDVIEASTQNGATAESSFAGTLILGGQIKGGPPRLFLIYPEGNFIEASGDNPFFQIGEAKYGKPILVRAFDTEMSYAAAVKLLLVSFDSTIKANLSVGPPIDYQVYETETFGPGPSGRIELDDPYYDTISKRWGEALRAAFDQLPDFELPPAP
ncbi:MAG: proteasome-type protease [Pseudomonadota bacterium]